MKKFFASMGSMLTSISFTTKATAAGLDPLAAVLVLGGTMAPSLRFKNNSANFFSCLTD